jgi:hypothetical protein
MRPIAVIEVLKGFDLRPQLSQRGRQVADPVELIAPGAVVSFHGAIEFGRTWGQDVEG